MLGGTFDPPHVGHLVVAADALDALGVDRVVFVPTGAQPFKGNSIWASPAARLAMTRLAVGDDPCLAVDAIEIDRGGLSYTVDTLREWARRSPGDRRFLLLGADAARSIGKWRDPLTVLDLAELVVLRRGDFEADEVEHWLPRTPAGTVPPYRVLDARRIDVSSTEIRVRVQAGRSIRGFVPDAVREYIEHHLLYRAAPDPEAGNDQRIDQ